MKLHEIGIDGWIEVAQDIAMAAHWGQVRNDGGPYIEHPLRVANKVSPRLKPIAILHDTIEDTHVKLSDLKEVGFPSYVIDAVDVLTHKNKEPNVIYWGRIAENKDAVIVKLYDIRDNLAGNPSDHARAKYIKAIAFFKERGFSLDNL